MDTMKLWVKCERCNGQGIIKAYGHVKGGVCFRCRLDVEALSAPGDRMVAPEILGGNTLRVGHQYFRLLDMLALGRRGIIMAAYDLLQAMDRERCPRGYLLAELVCLARVAEGDVSARIFKALAGRVRGSEADEIEGIKAILGMTQQAVGTG